MQVTNNRFIVNEYVPVLQRALAASESDGLCEVAKHGKIIYLVKNDITQSSVAIWEELIAAELAKYGRSVVVDAFRRLSDALRPFVGKQLLTSGVWLAGKRYELYVDPLAETVVHCSRANHPDPEVIGIESSEH